MIGKSSRNMLPQRISFPVFYVLNQQDIAVFQFGSAELVQILLQTDEMVLRIKTSIELARAEQCFINRLCLAIPDN